LEKKIWLFKPEMRHKSLIILLPFWVLTEKPKFEIWQIFALFFSFMAIENPQKAIQCQNNLIFLKFKFLFMAKNITSKQTEAELLLLLLYSMRE
jgi:hypothetical protein